MNWRAAMGIPELFGDRGGAYQGGAGEARREGIAL
jgi:hypothetical protein